MLEYFFLNETKYYLIKFLSRDFFLVPNTLYYLGNYYIILNLYKNIKSFIVNKIKKYDNRLKKSLYS